MTVFSVVSAMMIVVMALFAEQLIGMMGKCTKESSDDHEKHVDDHVDRT